MAEKKSSSHRGSNAERTARTKALLKRAAIETILTTGRSQTASIAYRAGVKPMLVDYHFGSREGLIVEAMREHLENFIIETEFVLAALDRKKSMEENIEIMVDGLWKIFSGDLFYISLENIVESRTNPAVLEGLIPLVRKFHDSLNALWNKAFFDYDASPEQIRLLMNMTLGLLRGLGVQTIQKPDAEYFQSILSGWKALLMRELKIIRTPAADADQLKSTKNI